MKQLSIKLSYFMFAALLAAGSIVSSCSKDDTKEKVDLTALTSALSAANTLLSTAVEGVADGQYQTGSKAALEATITTVQAIHDDPAVTQVEVANAIVTLSQAVTAFNGKLVIPIAQEELIAQWLFNEGTGTVVNDAASTHDGTLLGGHSAIVGAGGVPTWTSDRYGEANKALHFDMGGHIEVPFTTDLNPAEMTISLWLNADVVWENNYIISQNWWLGYKLSLQSVNKVFYTANSDEGIWDRDWEVAGLPVSTWIFVAVTYKAGEMNFYSNGVLVKSWTNTPGALKTITGPEKFVIGQSEPNEPIVAPADDPAQWGVGYFKGSLDEIRMYKKALTGTQIQSIYNLEKVPAE
jgi:hypothetical protein